MSGTSKSSFTTIDDLDNIESTAKISKNGTLSKNILEFSRSYGYDCKRLFNLCLIDQHVLVFASGNLLHFLTISTKQIQTRRTIGGGGIGYITKNPNPTYNYLTVAENGIKPLIFIYKYPEMTPISICRNGTERTYSSIDYTTDGELMASQGGSPDYMITVWNWKMAEVILKCKSFHTDVFRVLFSIYDFEQLVTCGNGHIKFWKMAHTFTGLKLLGYHGRFGKTEISDIHAAFILMGDRILSGTTWGNILVWEDNFIKLEVCRKNRKPCHDGAITQINSWTNEIMTIGVDGYVRIWFWETVDLANPTDEDRFVEIEPLFQYKVGEHDHDCKLMYMLKMEGDNNVWCAQDGNGGIWKCEITPDGEPEKPEMLLRCHAGEVVAMGVCPFAFFIATLGKDGRLHIYDCNVGKLVAYRQFPANGRQMIWLPTTTDPSGSVIVMGFDDGTIKVVVISLKTFEMKLLQVIKPHYMAITVLSINPRKTILVSGSEDATIFLNQIVLEDTFIVLQPIGFVDMPSAVSAINWKPEMYSTALIGCWHGEVLELDIPAKPRTYTYKSYKLEHIETKRFKFQSVKSELLRQKKIREIDERREKKRLRKMESLERLRQNNPDIIIDEDTYLADSESDEELEPIHIPKIPNRILWLEYTPKDTIWLSMAGYDAGYLYEYQFNENKPYIRCQEIPDAEDIEIHSYLKIPDYLIFGLQNGAIRINRINQLNFRYLSDYWQLSMHCNANGNISAIKLSHDNRFLFTIGVDGNIFCYKLNLIIDDDTDFMPPVPVEMDFEEQSDIYDFNCLSLEQEKQKMNADAHQKIIDRRKERVYEIIGQYESDFRGITERNKCLKKSQQIALNKLELDRRITAHLHSELNELMKIERQKVAFDVEKTKIRAEKVKTAFLSPIQSLPIRVDAIGLDVSLKTFRNKKLSDYFAVSLQIVSERIKNEMDRKRAIQFFEDNKPLPKRQIIKAKEIYLGELSEETIQTKMDLQFRRLLKQCRDRKLNEQYQDDKWQHIHATTPNLNENDPSDVKAIKTAMEATGDYKLKSDLNFSPDITEREGTSKKFLELLKTRRRLNDIQGNYNARVIELKKRKIQLVTFVEKQIDLLKNIHKELKEDEIIPLENIPNVHIYRDEFETCGTPAIQNTESSEILLEESEEFQYFSKTNNNQPLKYLLLKLIHTNLQSTESDDSMACWSEEINQIRHIERLFQQQKIFQDIYDRIKAFNDEVLDMKNSTLTTEYECKYMEVYMLTLNQELWIIKDFEHLEEKLVEKVDKFVTDKNSIQTNIMRTKSKIEDLRMNIDRYNEQESSITSQFMSNCKGNKFFAFLKRIYQKKLKADKNVNRDGSSSSSSSSVSSSEEEDDNISGDSADIGHIYLDESVCPAGCDSKLYNLVFELRNQRHFIEKDIRVAKDKIQALNVEVSELEKNVNEIDQTLSVENENLIKFTREKQQIINQIETLIILKMDQMQYFRNRDEYNEVEKTLLFKNDVIKMLYDRVGQLEIEALEVQREHRINKVHLARLKTDCTFMENMLNELQDKSKETMIKKFGMRLQLDDLEETLLKNFLNIMYANVDDIHNEYRSKITALMKTLQTKQSELKHVLQQGIEKLNILTVLQEEQNLITNILSVQEKNDKKTVERQHYPFDKDVNNMRNLSKRLDRQVANLEKNIRTLQLKAKPFNPIPGVPSYVVDYPSNNIVGGNVYSARDAEEDDEYDDDDEDDTDDDEDESKNYDRTGSSMSRCSSSQLADINLNNV